MKRTARAASAVVAALTIATAACGQPADSPGDVGSEPGWTELPEYSMADVRSIGIYAAGDQLIVAGGLRWEASGSEEQSGFPTAESQAFNPKTGEWRDLGSLPTDGHDGLIPIAGTWTGSELIVLGTACDDYTQNMDVSGYPCTTVVAASWDPEAGWQSIELPPIDANAQSISATPTAPPGQAIFSVKEGMLVWDSAAEDGNHWSVKPWPTISDGSTLIGLCFTADRWFLAGASDPTLMSGTKTYASVDASGQNEILYGTFSVSPDRPSVSPGGPVCLDDAVLYRPDLDQPIVRVSIEGEVTTFTPPNAPTGGIEGGVPPSLTFAVPVGNAMIIPTAEHLYYLTSSGESVNLPPSPPMMDPYIPIGDLIFAHLHPNYDHPRAGQWYVLNLADPAKATFPLPADVPVKKGS